MAKTKRKELVIFDLDGTLVDAYLAVSSSINFTMKSMGLPLIDDQTIKRSVGWGDRNLLERFVASNKVDKALSIYRVHHRDSLRNGTKFLPGAKELIKNLKKSGYRLAIASNRPTAFSMIILKHLRINEQFDYVLCADKVERPKPSGDMLHKIVAKFKTSVPRAVFVGDMTIDAQAGKDAGMDTIIVLTGSSERGEIEILRPYRIVERIEQVNEVLYEMEE